MLPWYHVVAVVGIVLTTLLLRLTSAGAISGSTVVLLCVSVLLFGASSFVAVIGWTPYIAHTKDKATSTLHAAFMSLAASTLTWTWVLWMSVGYITSTASLWVPSWIEYALGVVDALVVGVYAAAAYQTWHCPLVIHYCFAALSVVVAAVPMHSNAVLVAHVATTVAKVAVAVVVVLMAAHVSFANLEDDVATTFQLNDGAANAKQTRSLTLFFFVVASFCLFIPLVVTVVTVVVTIVAARIILASTVTTPPPPPPSASGLMERTAVAMPAPSHQPLPPQYRPPPPSAVAPPPPPPQYHMLPAAPPVAPPVIQQQQPRPRLVAAAAAAAAAPPVMTTHVYEPTCTCESCNAYRRQINDRAQQRASRMLRQ